MHTRRNAFKAAFPLTLPICAGFLFVGLAYGVYMNSRGFSFLYPMLMSMTVFAGSMEFVAVTLLLSPFQPLYAFFLTLMVNARHLFYGLSMLEKYRGVGAKKWYLVFGMCDESFSINCNAKVPDGVDRGWFMFFVTLLNHIYWVVGATLGGLLGGLVPVDMKGIEFVMTALFVVIFLDQWLTHKKHLPGLIGIIGSALCLIVFGADNFILPAMALMLALLTLLRPKLDDQEMGETP